MESNFISNERTIQNVSSITIITDSKPAKIIQSLYDFHAYD